MEYTGKSAADKLEKAERLSYILKSPERKNSNVIKGK